MEKKKVTHFVMQKEYTPMQNMSVHTYARPYS